MRRLRVALALGVVVGGLAIALSFPERNRGVALLAYLLVLGVAAAAGLHAAASRSLAPADERFWRPQEPPPRRLLQLELVEHEVGEVLAAGADTRNELGSRFRAAAAAQLARRHGIDLEREPQRARAAIADPLTWELVQAGEQQRTLRRTRLGAAELRHVLDVLERL